MVIRMDSFSDKLKSLGVQVGPKNLVSNEAISHSFPIQKVISGREDTTVFGNTFILEKHTSSEDRQGRVHFQLRPDFSTLAAWRKYPGLIDIPLNRILFLDTETSGLSGGTGTFAFMIGLGYIDDQGFHLFQLFLRHPAEEMALLASLARLIEGFDVIVTFNGASFDIPLMNARHIMNAVQSPFANCLHIDLLPLARRLWKNRLASRRLGNLEIEILHLRRTQEEVPGWMVPEIYYDYLISGDARPLAGVFYHNEMDIRSLGALFLYIADLLTKPLAYVADEGLDLIAIGRLFEELGQPKQALELYDAGIQAGLPVEFFIQTSLRYAEIFRKNGQISQSCNLWEKAANLGSMEACIHLSKYYEHHEKSFNQAYYWADQAQKIILTKNINSEFTFEYLLSPIVIRLKRLQTKIKTHQ